MEFNTITRWSNDSFCLEIRNFPEDCHNQVYHTSVYAKDLLQLPKKPYCEVRELPDWKTKIHMIFDPEAQKLIESFHRYGPSKQNPEKLCPFTGGKIKQRFSSLIGENNLGSLHEGESERYRKTFESFFNKNKLMELKSEWKDIARIWSEEQINKGNVGLFQSCHELIARCLINGILSFSESTPEDIDFNVSYWKELFSKLPHELKSLEELKSEGEPGIFQWGFNLAKDWKEFSSKVSTYLFSSGQLDSLAFKIYENTCKKENSLCKFLLSKNFTLDEILENIKGTLLAGQETMGYLLGFIIYEYSKNPNLQQIHAINPKEIEKVYLEALRLYSPAGAMREAGTDFIIEPVISQDEQKLTHYVKKGDLIACVPFLSGHDPEIWENPEQFDCERSNLDKVKSIPHFGNGKHKCIGEKAGKLELMVIIEVILTSIVFDTNEVLPPLIDSFTLRPVTDIPINFKSRNFKM